MNKSLPTALFVCALGLLAWWYNTRLQQWKDAEADAQAADDWSETTLSRLRALKRRVTWEGVAAFLLVFVLVLVFNWIF